MDERLKAIFITWANDTLERWISEYDAWDYLLDSNTLTEEELEEIQNNISWNIQAKDAREEMYK